MNIFVGGLSWDTSEDSLKACFEEYGEVSSAKIILDRETGRSRGFGFVEMSDDEQGRAAIEALNESSLDGRNIRVNEARPREGGGGGGGYRGGGGGGYRGGGGGGYRGGGGGGYRDNNRGGGNRGGGDYNRGGGGGYGGGRNDDQEDWRHSRGGRDW